MSNLRSRPQRRRGGRSGFPEPRRSSTRAGRRARRHRTSGVLATVVALVAGVAAIALPTTSLAATPTLTWGPEAAITLGSDPQEIAPGDDGSVWVTDATDDTVTEITDVDGVPTAQDPISLLPGSGPTGITRGLDGSLWVGNAAAGTVQQIVDVAGTWTPQAPIPVAVTGAFQLLVTAPDGSIWIVFRATQSVQQIKDAAGTWEAQAVLTTTADATMLVFDSLGTGWVGSSSGTITPIVDSGGASVLGTPVSTPFRSNLGTAGPQGTLYLSDAGCRMYQFDPATATQAWAIDPGSCDTESIAYTSDTSLWLTSRDNGFVTRWDSGTHTRLNTFYVGQRPRDLTEATDGSLWFVNAGSHTVQRLANRAAVASTITGADSATFTVGANGSFTITTSGGFPTPTIRTLDPLPYGLALTDHHDGTATISGVASLGTEGVYHLTVDAVSGDVSGTQAFTLTVPGTPPDTLTVPRRAETGGWATCEVSSITSSADANLWISAPSSSQLLHYSTAPLTLVEQIPVGADPRELTTASDGTIWFINRGDHDVQSVRSSGGAWVVDDAITVGSNPQHMTAGADGSVWVADPTDATVTQITDVAGTRSAQTPISLDGTTLSGITTGIDGSIWVADSAAGTVIRIADVGGTWTPQAPVALTTSGVDMKLSVGPDGSVWIVLVGTSQIQQVSEVAGTWTAQAELTMPGTVRSIVPATGGTLWVGFPTGMVVQLVEIDGAWVPLGPVSTGYRSELATTTSDGSLWWSDAGCALWSWQMVTGVQPVITSPPSGSATVDEYTSIPLTSSGAPAATLTVGGDLPAGMGFQDNANGTGTLYGSPSDSNAAGEHHLKIIAANGAYRAVVQDYTLTLLTTGSPTSTSTSTSTSTTAPTSTTSTSTTAPTSTTSTSTTAPTSTTSTSTTAPSTTTTEAPPGSTTTAPTSGGTLPGAVLDEAQVKELPIAVLTSPPPTRTNPFRVRASGFLPGEPVEVIVASTPIVVAETIADGAGAIDVTASLPDGIEGGSHELAVYGLQSRFGLRQTFDLDRIVVAAPLGSTAPLAATGANSTLLMRLGLVLVIAGAVLFEFSSSGRRRRPRRLHARR